MPPKPPTLTATEYHSACSDAMGWCRRCQALTTDACEPDARNYACADCGHRTVFGAEEAMMMGLFDVTDACEGTEEVNAQE